MSESMNDSVHAHLRERLTRRVTCALTVLVWPVFVVIHNTEFWPIPASFLVYFVVLRTARSGPIVRCLYASLFVATFLLLILGPSLAGSRHSTDVFEIWWFSGWATAGLIAGIACEVGDRPRGEVAGIDREARQRNEIRPQSIAQPRPR
ncbi:hypothetical protein GC176_27150 [bacterium]|nr:hypothetical protein [bacterium]